MKRKNPKVASPIRLDLEWLKTPEFSHGEALRIAGVTAEQLQTWYKREIIREFTDRPKHRGIRRKYSRLDLMHLTALKEISGAGIPLLLASVTAMRMVQLMLPSWELQLVIEKPSEWPSLLFVIYWVEGEVRFDVWMAEDKSFPEDGVTGWMRRNRVERVHLIEPHVMVSKFLCRLGERGARET